MRRTQSQAASDAVAPSTSASDASNVTQPQYSPDDPRHQQPSASGDSRASRNSSLLADNPLLLRRLLNTESATEALDIIIQQHDKASQRQLVSESEADLLISSSLEAGNVSLALSIYRDMCATRRAQARKTIDAACVWPAATLQTTVALVQGLCRQLRVAEALDIMEGIRAQGMPTADEVSFGYVVNSPLPPCRALAVVQPQEGSKLVSDSSSLYEFELFSGTVVSCSSEALQPANNPIIAAARAVGLWKRPAVGAVHELVVQAPDGTSRTFRAGTATADVPAQVGERITVVCAPNQGKNKQRRLLLTTSPPNTRPGQPMAVTNHRTGAALPLLQPPVSSSQASAPSWVIPATILLAGSDVASGLIDPSLPTLIAAGAAVAVGSTVAGNTLLLPRLKQLPANAVKVESIRQQLLAQHASLGNKVKQTLQVGLFAAPMPCFETGIILASFNVVVLAASNNETCRSFFACFKTSDLASSKLKACAQEAGEDVRTLARLWQLQVKMESVDGAGGTAYEARIERVAVARAGVEQRLSKRLELLDGYARVMNMIEIEVEMEIEVPAAELAGIEEQIDRLYELEDLQQEWQLQAEAQDEVEKLLRSSPVIPTLDRVT
eukprot:jgi/Chrzof1/12174/Cz06g23240.t1